MAGGGGRRKTPKRAAKTQVTQAELNPARSLLIKSRLESRNRGAALKNANDENSALKSANKDQQALIDQLGAQLAQAEASKKDTENSEVEVEPENSDQDVSDNESVISDHEQIQPGAGFSFTIKNNTLDPNVEMYDEEGLAFSEKYINDMGEDDILDYDDSEFDPDQTENTNPPDQTGQVEGNINEKEDGELSDSEETPQSSQKSSKSDGKSNNKSAKESQNVSGSTQGLSLTKSMGEDLSHAKPNAKDKPKVSNTGKGPTPKGGASVRKPFPKIQRRVPTKTEIQLKKLKDSYVHFTSDLKEQMRKADASYAKSVATLR